MNQLPRFHYTKCLAVDLHHRHPTLGDTGLVTKWFFGDENDLRLRKSLQNFETVIKVDRLFLPTDSNFTLNEPGVWASRCFIPMGAIYSPDADRQAQ